MTLNSRLTASTIGNVSRSVAPSSINYYDIRRRYLDRVGATSDASNK